MAMLIYALCALTALACALLLLAGSRRTGSRMLLWSGLCFGGLALTNALIVVDAMNLTTENLWTMRLLVALGSIVLLLYGLIFEEK